MALAEVREETGNPALSSYRNAQSTLVHFIGITTLKQQNSATLDELKEQLAEKDVPKSVTVDDKFAIMEKSYQMAAKYLPTGFKFDKAPPAKDAGTATAGSTQKRAFCGIHTYKKEHRFPLCIVSLRTVPFSRWAKQKPGLLYRRFY